MIIFFFNSSLTFADFLFSEAKFKPSKKWYKSDVGETDSIKHLLKQLVRSESGKNLVIAANKKAKTQGDTLYDILKAGNGSLTDTTLIRKFSVENPEDIQFESRSIVYVNKDLTQYDALLDLAHELTHFVYRKPFNPYKMNFTLTEFIKNTVEGDGGEARAFLTECRIQKDLFPSQSTARQNCQKILDSESDEFSFPKAVTHFYEVGTHYEKFRETLSKFNIEGEFEMVSNKKASFISSAYGIPYPVAAFEEYLSVLNKVCENDKKRIGYMKMKSGVSRSPASINKIEQDFKKKCAPLFQ